uniref:Uncharacterized protein n=1 Tax=Fagus sylvatica TaxID=28930 RepID=A0A2N9HLK9_FAGSY
MAQTGISAAVAPAHSKSTITLTTDQLEDIITQALIRAGNASSSSTLSVLPGKFSSWLLDSACCNHMTPYPSFFSHTSSTHHAPNIHTANGSTMLVRSIGTVSTSKLSIFDVFHVPQLSYNLLSVGQLAELGYHIILDYYGCVVQDPRTGQELGTGRRIGRLFEISSLRLPATGVSTATSSSPSLSLWHSRLGHASSSRAPPSKTEEPKENFDTSLTLFVLSYCLPKFLYPFGEKLFSLLPMPSIVFQAQPFLIRLLMSAFLDLHLTINISDPLALPVSSFFSLMNITNSSLVLAFVASLVMVKLKKDIDVMILLLIAFASPAMLSFGNIVCSLRYLNFTESSDYSSGSSSQEMPHSSPESLAPVPSEDPAPTTTLHRSSRVTSLLSHLRDFHCYTALATLHEPHSYREAFSNPLWQAAMTEELDALSRNCTWDLVDLPSEKSVVGCKWVFKIKTRSNGSIERYKAHLVAKGFTQEYGIDYEETFAPVARLSSVRTLLAVAASCQWKLFQMDVKNAFLNGDLSEEVYMQPPPGLSHPLEKVCRLRRALYGLKQAPRAWFAKFSSTVSQLGFSISSYDSALFLRRTGKDTILLLLYVDDMIITGDDLNGIQELKAFLSQNFEMKDLGHLSYFLGLEITSSDDGFYLTQANLVYLTVTRPNISYAVHQVSQFMSAPRSTHYVAVLRILRYFKGTLFHGLHFSAQSPLTLRAYSDADWVGDPTDRRSATGYCFLLGSSLISWRSKKQSVVARSSIEAEYHALADTTSELL